MERALRRPSVIRDPARHYVDLTATSAFTIAGVSRDPLEHDRLETHLGELMQAACNDPHASAQLEELGEYDEGAIQILYWGGSAHPIASVNQDLELDNAEATTLHEAGHWVLGHEDDPDYVAAVAFDRENNGSTRGPWEQAADRKALELLGDPDIVRLLETEPERIGELLMFDGAKYGDFEVSRGEPA